MFEREKEALEKNLENTNEQGSETLETPRAEQSQSSPNPTARRYGADDVERRAYQRFIERGGEHGHDMDDWFDAERELHAQGPEETATPSHGDEVAAAPEPAPVAPRAAPKGRGSARTRKGPNANRPDRAADEQQR
jgi:hypothetical protein